MEKITVQVYSNRRSLAHAMKASMEKRETVLLENDVLLAAVFVDPMYRITLTEEQQEGEKHYYPLLLT